MGTDIRTGQFSEQTIKQAKADCQRSMVRGRFCPEQSEILQFRCVDERPESDRQYGSQLWYFEGEGIDNQNRRHLLFGFVEYSTQYGLNELVDDGIFESENQRDRVRYRYEGELLRPSWRHPAHRWLALGLIFVSTVWLLYMLMRTLTT